jgi:hypothetical protein
MTEGEDTEGETTLQDDVVEWDIEDIQPYDQSFPGAKYWRIFVPLLGLIIGLSFGLIVGLHYMSSFELVDRPISRQLSFLNILSWDQLVLLCGIAGKVLVAWVVIGMISMLISRLGNKPVLGLIGELLVKLSIVLFFGALFGMLFGMFFAPII